MAEPSPPDTTMDRGTQTEPSFYHPTAGNCHRPIAVIRPYNPNDDLVEEEQAIMESEDEQIEPPPSLEEVWDSLMNDVFDITDDEIEDPAWMPAWMPATPPQR